jgi:hypothetical protein
MPSSPALEPPGEVVAAAQKASAGVSSWLGRWLHRPSAPLVPLHVFVVELGSLLKTEGLLDIAQPAGWRFQSAPQRDPQSPEHPAETPSPGRRPRTRPREPIAIEVAERPIDVWIERGPTIGGVDRALREARELREAGDGVGVDRAVFEPRMLRVPEAHLTAVWFRDKLGNSEAVVPIAPAPSEFEPFRRYAASDFLQTAASLARRKLEDYSSAEGELGELGG